MQAKRRPPMPLRSRMRTRMAKWRILPQPNRRDRNRDSFAGTKTMLWYRTIRSVAMSLALAASLCGVAAAQYFTAPETKTISPPGLEGVGIDQRLNEQVPLNLT